MEEAPNPVHLRREEDDGRRSLLLLLLLLLLLGIGAFLFLHNNKPTPVVQDDSLGIIYSQTHDTRIQIAKLGKWFAAQAQQKIYARDIIQVYSESNAQIQLKDQNSLSLSANSAALFDQINGKPQVHFCYGSVYAMTRKQMNIATNGNQYQIVGDNSQIQIFTQGNYAQVKVISGNVQIQGDHGPAFALAQGAQWSAPAFTRNTASASDACPPAPVLDRAPASTTAEKNETYFWKIFDLYDIKGSQIIPKSGTPNYVYMNKLLSWSYEGTNAVQVLQSSQPDFKTGQVLSSTSGQATLPIVNIGWNYWKIRSYRGYESPVQKFYVNGTLIPQSAPEIQTLQLDKWNQDHAGLKAEVQTKLPMTKGHIVEVARDTQFAAKETYRSWSSGNELQFQIFESGNFAVRARSVNTNGELSEWSRPQEFSVKLPSGVRVAPRIAKAAPPKILAPVAAIPPPPAAKPEARAPAAISDEVMGSVGTPGNFLVPLYNEKYKNSSIAVSGFMWTQYSTLQEYLGETSPVNGGGKVHGIYWKGSQGVEGDLKLGVLGFNEAGRKRSGLQDFEARYHYRFFTDFPWQLTRELQISFFGGFEYYKNNNDFFNPGYNMLKLGNTYNFPWDPHINLGGEFELGVAPDMSLKKEISGFISYFYNRDWSIGVGYRVHLFDAATSSSSPTGRMPYREGYTEGFSTLRFHY